MVIVYEYREAILFAKDLFVYFFVLFCLLASSAAPNNFKIEIGRPKKLPDIEESLELLTRGKSHSCTKSMRVTNIKELAETGSSKCIEKVNERLDDLFTLSNEEFTMKEHFLEMAENNTKLKPVIICNDITQLVQILEKMRGKKYTNLKIGMDGGERFFYIQF
ncbi:hypothetical protein A3Q56_07074 [Intoshia linei]|uniref:Uncharacterized protein n=1 Tax=Intoshia linei TaxID=1819745 RepID=A0A177AUZ2_9BILA|nr:hypothetical protein A3Q56_07074 [Intoshia linei]